MMRKEGEGVLFAGSSRRLAELGSTRRLHAGAIREPSVQTVVRRRSGRTDSTCKQYSFHLLILAFFLLLSAQADAKRAKASKVSGKLVEIQSINKTRVTGWVFEKGGGTRIVRGIELKFKIHRSGTVSLPILVAYLFDRDNNLVKKIDTFLINKGMRFVPGTEKTFKGKKTHLVVFPYENEARFKYYLVVAGEQGNLSARVEPKDGKIEDFTFEEKGLL